MLIADDPEAQTRLRQAYTHALQTGARTWRRAANAVAEVHGLSDATAYPLVMIGRLAGERRQNAVAEAVGIEGPSLVRLLDQLAAAGLVVRREDPSDRRAKVLDLTPRGRAMVAQIEAELATLRARLFAGVSAADLEASLRVFAALQAYGRDPGPNGTKQESVA
ncbi:MarR family transcriptional regulator [Methylobacterium sp. J-001]|uniref:MarR family winged helix-turn-helix transcriptional regulator n=1 Tax=Methylobacterium sp. J-001 TaxID=2836609 RepID=UPI001FBA6013|nr:MarR family transcriptional regulator [Methylobacterium sp. J-001]MCJ2116682.1 MarR family transcriptional regulator [Methylobacterium sp. J-001]